MTMTFSKLPSLAALLLSAVRVTAHGHVDWLIANGVAYRGYDAPSMSWNPNQEPVVGWITGATDNGYVEPNSFGDPDIICHRNAKNAKGHVTVQAGDKVTLQWNTWPESHKGPVIDYLARCSGSCETVDKASLEFFKISAAGLLDMSLQSGRWADDVILANNLMWTVQVPANLAAGNYVLRHEIIALHGAGQPNGAQSYPQCFNIQVIGGGSLSPAGVKATSLYKSNDPGILFNLYTSPLSYTIPGPTLVSGLPSTVAQISTWATATSSATTPGANSNSLTSSSSPSNPTTSAGNPSTTGGNTAQPTTLRTSTTSSSSSKAVASTDNYACGPISGGLPKYSQCGGLGYTGPTICNWGSICTVVNSYYSQCL